MSRGNFDKLGEECGVFGAYDMDGGDVAPSVYYGLFALQHRGQESCGIAVTDTYGKRKVHFRKGLGLVNEVFFKFAHRFVFSYLLYPLNFYIESIIHDFPKINTQP